MLFRSKSGTAVTKSKSTKPEVITRGDILDAMMDRSSILAKRLGSKRGAITRLEADALLKEIESLTISMP